MDNINPGFVIIAVLISFGFGVIALHRFEPELRKHNAGRKLIRFIQKWA